MHATENSQTLGKQSISTIATAEMTNVTPIVQSWVPPLHYQHLSSSFVGGMRSAVHDRKGMDRSVRH
eukprot:5054024-Amphidinium_carterae.1